MTPTPRPPEPRPHSHRLTPCCWALVLLALLFAQCVGQWHAVAHAPVAAAHADHADESETHADDAQEAGHSADGALAGLFAGHEAHGQDCRLYDQHGHSALLPAVPALALPDVLALYTTGADAGRQPAPPRLPFEARGPPA